MSLCLCAWPLNEQGHAGILKLDYSEEHLVLFNAKISVCLMPLGSKATV